MTFSSVKRALCCLLSLILLDQTVIAGNTKRHGKELTKIEQEIQRLKLDLKQARQKQASLTESLKQIELGVSRTELELTKIQRQLSFKETALSQIQRKYDEAKQRLTHQQDKFEQQLVLTYQLGKQPALKMLLAQEDPSKILRQLTYYGYLNRARLDAISTWQNALSNVETLKESILNEEKALTRLQQHQEQAQASLTQQLKQREALLARTEARIRSQDQRLAKLLEDKYQLEHVVEGLSPTHQNNQARWPFQSMQGKLEWPTEGHVAHLFGKTLANSQLQWNGELIYATEGKDIHAVAAGRVIYAGWLRGFGLLLIIDHGNGYMSLYGRNQSLYKHLGNEVTPGETIARVGRSGGYHNSGLYFAIRHGTTPLDPNRWCRK